MKNNDVKEATKAISIKQPWAWLICAGHKDIENRTWPTRQRGVVLIHSPKTADMEAREVLREMIDLGLIPKIRFPLLYNFSGIVGAAEIVDCVAEHHSPWFFGPFGFVLKNQTLFTETIDCSGALGFWTPSPQVVAKAKEQL